MTTILPDLLAVVIVFAVAFAGSLGAVVAWDWWTERRGKRALTLARAAISSPIFGATCATVGPLLATKSPAERLADVTDPHWRARVRK
jgi:alpha-beta hydrolase superfamily lysophospholipase